MKRLTPKNTPHAIRLFPSLSGSYESHFYEHMFIQDIHIGVMPIGGRSVRRKDFDVSFQGNEQAVNSAKRLCLSLGEYNSEYSPIKEIISDTVENIAKNLSWVGISFYEIINNPGDQACPYLHWFTEKRMIKIPGWYLQITPKNDFSFIHKRTSWIRKSDVWCIKIPTKLGGYHGYKKLLSSLRKTNSLAPKFAQDRIELIQSTPGFDFTDYNANLAIMVNRLTGKWGWNRRDSSDDYSTEFYSIYKYLSLDLSKAILREHIISELNKLLKRLRIECSIQVVGLSTVKDIQQIRDGLFDGKTDFNKVFDSVTF
jgi:hypothetical protein